MNMISHGKWMDSSGKVSNPGKSFFFRLATAAVLDDNSQSEADGLTYVGKEITRAGMELNTNELWDESHISYELKEITVKDLEYFDGKEAQSLIKASFFALIYSHRLISTFHFYSITL